MKQSEPPSELLPILNAIMLGNKTCRKAIEDIEAIYAVDIQALMSVNRNLIQILERLGAPLNPEGDLQAVYEWAKCQGVIKQG